MIKRRATSVVAAVLIIAGLAVTPPLDNGETSESTASKPLPLQPPGFRISWRQGELLLDGHTVSAAHESSLLQVVAATFPNSTVITNFQPLGIAPGHWNDTTMQVLYLMAETKSAMATVRSDSIAIHAITGAGLGWRSRLDALKTAIPPTVTLSADAIVVDSRVDTASVCARAYASLETGAINFEESTAVFRHSAYPRLDRVIAFAATCRDSQISVTGHTDASGTERLNQRLSLKRAKAVADYIVAGGIERTRLNVLGVGSSQPVADDRTRYGRSLNRRIEIDFTGNKQ